MHIIRQKHGGDAMVLLALCGKNHFPVFEYVVETRIYASTNKDAISLHSLPVVSKSVPLEFLTEASKRLSMRFVRELAVMNPSPDRLPFEQITELTIHKFDKLFIPVVNSWTNLDGENWLCTCAAAKLISILTKSRPLVWFAVITAPVILQFQSKGQPATPMNALKDLQLRKQNIPFTLLRIGIQVATIAVFSALLFLLLFFTTPSADFLVSTNATNATNTVSYENTIYLISYEFCGTVLLSLASSITNEQCRKTASGILQWVLMTSQFYFFGKAGLNPVGVTARSMKFTDVSFYLTETFAVFWIPDICAALLVNLMLAGSPWADASNEGGDGRRPEQNRSATKPSACPNTEPAPKVNPDETPATGDDSSGGPTSGDPAAPTDKPKSQRAPPPANQNSHTIPHSQRSVKSTGSTVTEPSFSKASSSVISNTVQVVRPNTEPAPKANPDVAPATGDDSSGGPTSGDPAAPTDKPKSQRAPPPANQNSHTILHFQSSVESTGSSVTEPSFSEASSSVVSNIVQVVCPNTEPAPKVNPDETPATGNDSIGGPTSEDSAAPPLVKSDGKASKTVPSIDDKANNSAEVAATTTDGTPETTDASAETTAAKNGRESQQETDQGNNQKNRRKPSKLFRGCFPLFGR